MIPTVSGIVGKMFVDTSTTGGRETGGRLGTKGSIFSGAVFCNSEGPVEDLRYKAILFQQSGTDVRGWSHFLFLFGRSTEELSDFPLV